MFGISRLVHLVLRRRHGTVPGENECVSVHEPWTPEWVDETYANAMAKLRRLIDERRASVRPDSPHARFLAHLSTLSDDELALEIDAHTHPNPRRIGCPPREVLVELGRRTRPPGDRAWKHVSRCHPCTLEVRTITDILRPGLK